MVSEFNFSWKPISRGFALIFLCYFVTPARAQLFRKKSSETAIARSDYAYQTISTLKKKEKRKGFAGHETKFHFEKPTKPTSMGKQHHRSASVSSEHFGHRKQPIRRPIGSTKVCRVCGIKH